MHHALFIRSHPADYQWLQFCLRSIKKFSSGYSEIVLCVPYPENNLIDMQLSSILESSPVTRLHTYDLKPGLGMMQAMMVVMNADLICPHANYIHFFDCDCIFKDHTKAGDYLFTPNHHSDPKAFLPVTPYDEIYSSKDDNIAARAIWQGATSAALGWVPHLSTMHRIPVVHHKSIFAPCRDRIEKHTGKSLSDYLFQFGKEFGRFSEFEALGAFAVRHMRHEYEIVDAAAHDPRVIRGAGGPYAAEFKKVKCYWSHGGVTLAIRNEIEDFLK